MTVEPLGPSSLYSWIHATPTIVGWTFRDSVAKALPRLEDRTGYWDLLGYLMFGTFHDPHSGRLVLPQRLLARFEKKEDKRRYAAEPFLKAFKRDVLPDFTWTVHNYRRGLAREVLDRGLPTSLEQLLSNELQRLNQNLVAPEEKVYFELGHEPTSQLQRELLKATKETAVERAKAAPSKATRNLLCYLNTLPRNSFTKLVRRNALQAHRVAYSLEKFDKGRLRWDRTERSRNANLQLLRKIAEQPQPFYQPSSAGNTVRLFPLNESILMLSREVRRALTDG